MLNAKHGSEKKVREGWSASTKHFPKSIKNGKFSINRQLIEITEGVE